MASIELENFLRMKVSQFEELLRLVAPIIVKSDTVMREAIPVKERLIVTLRYLATGIVFKFSVSDTEPFQVV